MGESAEDDADTIEALPVGATISGYAIRRIIGHGGFGITYEAHNRVTGKGVAIKEFFPSSLVRRAGNSRLIYSKVNTETIGWALRKFEETTTTLCGLKHPNIVEVHDYVPANDTGYMIMELLEGQTLEHWLQARTQPPDLEELRPLVDPVMEALGYVHGMGLIHRDIAPDNILITREGRPVLIDFGSVSRDLSDARQKAMSSTVGMTKRYYTAPEQSRSKARPTPEADIYSMGAVLYRALSGDKPADGQDRVDAMFHEKGTDPYQPLMKRMPAGCTMRAAQAIDTALAVRPEGRLHKIDDLRAALVVPPVAPVAPKRPAKWLAAAALAVILAAAGGVFAGSRWARDDNRAEQATLDGERGEMGRAKADLARQQAALETARGDLAKQRGGADSAKTEVDRRSAAVDAEKAEVDRDRAAAEAEKTDVAKQRGDLDAAKAEIDRARTAIETDRADVAKQRDLLDAGRAGNDREGAAMRAAQAQVDQKQRETDQAKADLTQANQALQAAQGQLAQQRDQLAADRRRLDQDKEQLGQGAHDEAERLTRQLSDAQAQAAEAERRRAAAEAEAAGLRQLTQVGSIEIDRLNAQVREKDATVARLTAENEGLRLQTRAADAPLTTEPEPSGRVPSCTVFGLDPAGNNWLALRTKPNFQSTWSSTRMGPGTVVSAIGSSGAWKHVRLASGETGWANGRFLSCDSP